LAIGLAAVGALSIWLGWSNWLSEVEFDPYVMEQDSNAVPGTAICVGLLCALSAFLVLARARIAAFAALVCGTSALGAVILLAPTPFPTWIFESIDYDTPSWQIPLQFLFEPEVLWVYFVGALSLAYAGWLAVIRNPDWFSLSPSGQPNARAHGNWLRTVGVILLCALVWLVLRAYGPMSMISMAMPFDSLGMFGAFDGVLSFFAAVAILITLLNERAEVDEDGVRILLAPTGWTLFSAPWSRVKRVDVVRHETKPPSARLQQSVFWIPVTFSVHARRYVNGVELIEQIYKHAHEKGKRVQQWLVTDNAQWMAVALISWGCLAFAYVCSVQHLDWIEMSKTNYPPANFEAIASPVYYGILSCLAMACFGSALGVLSAFHCASVRPFLLGLFLAATAFVAPDNLIHWLVWIAIYHIYMAIPGQDPTYVVSSPTWQEWNLGMGLSGYAPVIAAVFYVVAVVLASVRLKLK
jgi:hypothetical protein